MSTYYFLIDVSHWDPSINWDLLKSNNVLSAIVKATDGSTGIDNRFTIHCDGANKAGLILGSYHFFRPWTDKGTIEAQAQFFLEQISSQPIKFIALDLESYTTNPANNVSPSVYSQRAKIAASYLAANSSLPFVIYTRTSFIAEHAPQMFDWIGNYNLWIAHWRYNNADLHSGRRTISWEDLIENHLPPYDSPSLPKSHSDWTIWQWTGEKFHLPGVTSLIDLNFFNGTKEDFYQWANVTTDECSAHSEPGDPDLPHPLRVMALIQVHSSPSMGAPVLGNLDLTSHPVAQEVCIKDGDKYARIGDDQWIAMRFKGVRFAEWG